METGYSIIVTYNGSKWIEKCIDSLLNSTVQTKIMVVDNNSSDNTVEIIEKNYSQTIIIKSEKNLGFGRANNIGLAKAYSEGADCAILLNQDAWIEPDTIGKLIQISQVNENAGVIAPLNFSPDGELESFFQKQLSSENCPGMISDLVTGKLKDYYPVTFFINASCWLITKKCLAEIGGFDPLFDHYGEDVDYCKRAMYHNFEVGICTSAKEYHARDNFRPAKNKFQLLLSDNVRGYLNNQVLFHLKDLNINFLFHFLIESATVILLGLKSLMKFSFKFVLIYIIMFFKLQMLFPRILHSRRECRQKQPSFLLMKKK
jgi:GT2 family glycosyltransferase